MEQPTNPETVAKQPRSREMSSREAESRETQMDLAHFEKLFEIESKGQTFMPPEATPPGYAGMWMRTATRGKEDSLNIANTLRQGWIAPQASNYPKVAFKNGYGEDISDAALINRPGLTWVLRPLAIHELHLKSISAKVNSQTKYNEGLRNMGNLEGGFMTGRGGSGNRNTVTFTQDPQAMHIASLFGH